MLKPAVATVYKFQKNVFATPSVSLCIFYFNISKTYCSISSVVQKLIHNLLAA